MIHTYTAPGGSYSRLYADMASKPHLLIAGKTGSGKSTVLNGIIHALLHDTPDADRFIMIDLKKVELSDYKYIPHLHKYADDGQSALQALQQALREIAPPGPATPPLPAAVMTRPALGAVLPH